MLDCKISVISSYVLCNFWAFNTRLTKSILHPRTALEMSNCLPIRVAISRKTSRVGTRERGQVGGGEGVGYFSLVPKPPLFSEFKISRAQSQQNKMCSLARQKKAKISWHSWSYHALSISRVDFRSSVMQKLKWFMLMRQILTTKIPL